MRWIGTVVTTLLAAAGSDCASAQQWPDRSEAAVDSLLHPTLASRQPLRFDRTAADLGKMREEEAPRRLRFPFVNTDAEPVVITRVGVGCRCMQAVWPKGAIAPGGSGEVELRFDPHNRPGAIDLSALVYVAGAGPHPVARLTLTGRVEPEADTWARFPHLLGGTLRLKQQEMVFRLPAGTAKASERILCGNAGKSPLRLTAEFIPPFATFRTEPEVIPPGGEADLVVTVDAGRLPATKEELSFPVIVKGIGGRPSERTVSVKIYRTKE